MLLDCLNGRAMFVLDFFGYLDFGLKPWSCFCSCVHSNNAARAYLTRGGGVLTLTWYRYMCLPFGALFREIWQSDQGFFIRDEGAQIHKLGVFYANYC